MTVKFASNDKAMSTPTAHSLVDGGALAVALYGTVLFLVPAEIWVHWGAAPDAAVSPALSIPIEIRAVIACSLLALVLPVLQIVIHIRQFGGAMIRSNRDGYPTAHGVAARIARAHTNLIESLVPFAAAVLAVHTFDISNRTTVSAAVVYLAARLVHAITYTLGITVIRSAAFYAGLIATAAIAMQLPLLG